MPFKKIVKGQNKGKFKSKSGRVYTPRQVKAYYASKNTKGWKRKPRKSKK